MSLCILATLITPGACTLLAQGGASRAVSGHPYESAFLGSRVTATARTQHAAAAAVASIEESENKASHDDVEAGAGNQHRADMRQNDGPLPPDFFHGFAEGESTFEEAVAQGRPDKYQSGWEPSIKGSVFSPTTVDADFFHESPSDGASGAWQSHYPRVPDSPGAHDEDWRGEHGRGAVWKKDLVGNWYQPYGYGTGPGGTDRWDVRLPPGWFDSAAYDQDGFGRSQVPLDGSPKLYATWKEQSVNTTLACEKRGCVANTTLTAPFDLATEQAHLCKLGLSVHATDFDEEHSDEKVEWIQVNDVQVMADCRPKASGCSEGSGKQLYPCLSEYPLDTPEMIPREGVFRISAKISSAVDECPYEGNLLSGVVWTTCLVAPKDPTPLALRLGELADASQLVFTSDLTCDTPGCIARSVMRFPSDGTLTDCRLSVYVNQTDFDGDDSTEVVEYLDIDDIRVSQNATPGKNPCKAKLRGTALTSNETVHMLVENQNVTRKVLYEGRLTVKSKISDAVDECAADGHLLAGKVEVVCSRAQPS